MTNEKENYIFNRAIDLWGAESQVMMAIEEMSELIKALCKMINRHEKDIENTHEEIVDVSILLDQMRKIFKLPQDKFMRIRNEKLERLEEKVKKYEKEHLMTNDDEYLEDDYVDMPYIEDWRK